MFDLGLGIGEIIVLVLLALIVVGPKELPQLFYKIGQFIGRLRAMASEFQNTMDDIAHEQEIDKAKKMIENQISQKTVKADDESNG
jgi:sec-independent protein translocase protein TatB